MEELHSTPQNYHAVAVTRRLCGNKLLSLLLVCLVRHGDGVGGDRKGWWDTGNFLYADQKN